MTKKQDLIKLAVSKPFITVRDAMNIGYSNEHYAIAGIRALENKKVLKFLGWGKWKYNG
jgi:hypothetical protein